MRIWIPERLYVAIPKWSATIGGLSLLILPDFGKILGACLVMYALNILFRRSQYL